MDALLRLNGAVENDLAIYAWLDTRVPELRAIAKEWFARMRACGEDVLELMHDGCPVACVEDAPFGYVNVFKDHVNVCFFLGADLDDRAGLLLGKGRRMRYVKVQPGDNLDANALSALIDAAYVGIKARLAAE